MPPDGDDYAALLERGREVYAPVRIGRPTRARPYWWLYPPAQALRLHWHVRCTGAEHVARGPAILVGNHLRAIDPILVGITQRWRLTFFTKAEVFEGRGALFFRASGQIPLRRGDEEATTWALAMSGHALDGGGKLAVYPEGTRSPDGRTMHRLHRRILVPVLQSNPGVPVHAMTISYLGRRAGREQVDLRFSPALPLDPDAMSANDLTDAVRDALLSLGGMPYVHEFARIPAR